MVKSQSKRGGKLRRRRKVPLSVIFGTKLSKRKRLKKWKIVKQRQKTKRMSERKKGKTRKQRKHTMNEGETVNCQNVNKLYDEFLCKFNYKKSERAN